RREGLPDGGTALGLDWRDPGSLRCACVRPRYREIYGEPIPSGALRRGFRLIRIEVRGFDRQHRNMDKKQSSLLWYLLGSVLLVAIVTSLLSQPKAVTIPYSDFKALLIAGKITEATISQDTIRAVVDLRGTERLLPADEYREIKEPPVPGRDSSGLQAKPSSPAAPPSQSPATQSMASSPGSPGAIQRSATNQAGSVAGPDLHEIQT